MGMAWFATEIPVGCLQACSTLLPKSCTQQLLSHTLMCTPWLVHWGPASSPTSLYTAHSSNHACSIHNSGSAAHSALSDSHGHAGWGGGAGHNSSSGVSEGSMVGWLSLGLLCACLFTGSAQLPTQSSTAAVWENGSRGAGLGARGWVQQQQLGWNGGVAVVWLTLCMPVYG